MLSLSPYSSIIICHHSTTDEDIVKKYTFISVYIYIYVYIYICMYVYIAFKCMLMENWGDLVEELASLVLLLCFHQQLHSDSMI